MKTASFRVTLALALAFAAVAGLLVLSSGANAQTATCGMPANPYGYTLCTNAGTQTVSSPPTAFCSLSGVTCIGDFATASGYLVQCTDGTFSLSGGVQGACSSHGGVGLVVYQVAVTPTATATTPAPTTAVPTTAVPTTAVPTTAVPTTAVPTTAVPITTVPTTAVPTTSAPATTTPISTVAPATVRPTLAPSAPNTGSGTAAAATPWLLLGFVALAASGVFVAISRKQ